VGLLGAEGLLRGYFSDVDVHLTVGSASDFPDFKTTPIFAGDRGALLGGHSARWVLDDDPGFRCDCGV
jgi:hypothetical protein